MSQKSALIFGISGQDGAYLAAFLLQKGYVIHGTSRDAEITSFESLKMLGIFDNMILHSVAITDFRSVLQCISKVQPDEIYNLAGQSSVNLSFQQPVETLESFATACLNILEAIRFLGGKIRFYNAGSSESFGDLGSLAATELSPFRPKSPYGVAKSAAFWEVANYRESYGLFVCSGILFNHESLIRPKRFVTRKVAAAAARIAMGSEEKLILGSLEICRDWGWAPEYVEAMWAMLQQSEPDDFIISTGIMTSLESFVSEAFAALNLDWREHVYQESSLLRPSEIHRSLGCSEKAAYKLGWTARTTMPEIAARMALGEMARLQGKE